MSGESNRGKKRGYRYIDVDVADSVVRSGIAFGLFQLVSDDGPRVFEFTPKGSAWFEAWLDEQLSIARMWAW